MEQVKEFYESHADEIWKKRFDSPFPIRQYVHRTQYEALLGQVVLGGSVLDAGCGEGVIGLLLAAKGIASTGMDLSLPNVQVAQRMAYERGVSDLATFCQGDAEHLPFPDQSFDTVISSHVLEHLPDFDQGFRELCRVARKRVIVALPTCLNLCAFSLLGGDHGYWRWSKRSIFALPWGLVRVLIHLFGEGVQEGYAGHDELPHIWRYPWVMRRRLRHGDFSLTSFQASSLALPYFDQLLPLMRRLDRYRAVPILRNFGYGSFAVLDRVSRPLASQNDSDRLE